MESVAADSPWGLNRQRRAHWPPAFGRAAGRRRAPTSVGFRDGLCKAVLASGSSKVRESRGMVMSSNIRRNGFCRHVRAQMLAKPRNRSGARAAKLREIRIEMSAIDGHELLGLERLLIGPQLKIGLGNAIGQGDDHQQRCGRHAGYPISGVIILERRPERTVTSFSQTPCGRGWR
jgi:hypothetical protein